MGRMCVKCSISRKQLFEVTAANSQLLGALLWKSIGIHEIPLPPSPTSCSTCVGKKINISHQPQLLHLLGFWFVVDMFNLPSNMNSNASPKELCQLSMGEMINGERF